jgi:hypothetical protein
MSPRSRAAFGLLALCGVAVILFLLFPAALRFVEGAARNIRQLWWLILLLALACWLIWGAGRKRN